MKTDVVEFHCEISVETVVAIGLSGGGPGALHFARKHPDRCDALILVSAVVTPMDPRKFSLFQRIVFAFTSSDSASYRNYQRLEKDPEGTIRTLFPDSATDILKDPEAVDHIPGARTVIFDTGGHLFLIPHRDRFVREITGFLTACDVLPEK